MRVSVVGLGPGPREWISPAASARLRAPGARVFARTRHFPRLDELLDGLDWHSLDDLYETSSSLDQLHRAMAQRLLAAGDDVVLAVPGDGALGEAILAHLADSGAHIDIVPGVSLGVGALAVAQLPAADGAQMVEATALGGGGIDLLVELNPRWPAVVTGVFSPRLAGDVKLALQRVYPAEHRVCLARHAGLPDEGVEWLALAELDRTRLDLDHLTHVVMPPVVGYTPTGSTHLLRATVARLRAPRIGCPWDLEQTHRSLIPYAIEEAYEVVDAI
ncbi:MAG TPA: SAM-dependent methyltransferase, partial [Chloroflexota bacterium]